MWRAGACFTVSNTVASTLVLSYGSLQLRYPNDPVRATSHSFSRLPDGAGLFVLARCFQVRSPTVIVNSVGTAPGISIQNAVGYAEGWVGRLAQSFSSSLISCAQIHCGGSGNGCGLDFYSEIVRAPTRTL